MATKAKTSKANKVNLVGSFPGSSNSIEVPALARAVLKVKVDGITPLLMHAWPEKARNQIRVKVKGEGTGGGRENRNPEQEVLASTYWYPQDNGDSGYDLGKYGLPAAAFKQAAVGACRDLKMKMTEARGRFHVIGKSDPITFLDLVRVEGEPLMHEAMVRVGMGADIRWRPMFPQWSAHLDIWFNTEAINPMEIANMLDNAGFSVGVGEWRPQKNGSNGMFRVDYDSLDVVADPVTVGA